MIVLIAMCALALCVTWFIFASSRQAARPIQGAYRTVAVTHGNLAHNHIYLSGILDFFPPDSIGGSSTRERAPRLLAVQFGDLEPVATDIAGDKKIFRERGRIGEFYRKNRVAPSDRVVIVCVAPYRYVVVPESDWLSRNVQPPEPQQ